MKRGTRPPRQPKTPSTQKAGLYYKPRILWQFGIYRAVQTGPEEFAYESADGRDLMGDVRWVQAYDTQDATTCLTRVATQKFTQTLLTATAGELKRHRKTLENLT